MAPSQRTYRCPVCGHRDATDVATETGTAYRVACSYCGATLDVILGRPTDLKLSAVVVDDADGDLEGPG